MNEQRRFEDWLTRFVRESATEAGVARFVDVVDAAILGQVPQIAADPVLVEDLHASTRGQWLSFLGTALQPTHRLVLPQQAADLARSLARRGEDLGALLKVYRAAHRGIYSYMSEVVDRLGDEDPTGDEVFRWIWNRADLWVDDSVEALTEIFYEERQRLHDGSVARRAETIEALVAGDGVDPDAATTTLGHPLRRQQTAFVAWAEASAPGTAEALLAVAGDLTTALGVGRVLTHLAGSRDLWGWVATTTAPDLDVLDDLGETLRGRGVRVGVGLPAPGATGFRSSHQEARAVQRLALAGAALPALTPYADVELLCLTHTQDGLLRRMVTREAGGLCGADKNLGLLRETVLTHLTHRMNVEATAARLFVHKNTVRYRIARAEELLGRPLTERPAQLEIALRHLAAFGGESPAG